MAEAAFTASFELGSKSMVLTFSAERLIFLGTASSPMMRSKTSTHCLRTISAVVEPPPSSEGKILMTVSVLIGYSVMVSWLYLNIFGMER